MKRSWIVLLLVAVMGLTACGGQQEGIVVDDPWVRPSPMIAGNGAGYMVIENHTDSDDALVGAEADFADTVEIHETFSVEPDDMEGMGDEGAAEDIPEMMGMRPVKTIAVPAGGEAALQPGGYHIMFIGVNEELEPGATVSVTLVFESGMRLDVEAEVRAQ